MAHYYTLGASLPDLMIDDAKIDYTTRGFVEELKGQASKSDQKQIDLLLLRGDNKALIAILTDRPIPVQYMPTALGEAHLRTLVDAVRSESLEDKQDHLSIPEGSPRYMIDFVRGFVSGAYSGAEVLFVEDKLAELYFDHVLRAASSPFLRDWFEMNLNLNNILASLTAKKYGLDPSKYLIGSNEITEILKSGLWGDIAYLKEGEMISEIVRIGEETEPMQRERRLDAFKWRILEEVTFADTFSIHAMLAYLLKLQILERWVALDKEQGMARFREIIMGLKKEGREELANFVQRTKK